MDKFIPFEKLPKKKQRELNRAKRGSWYGMNPVTRKPENPKAYNRRKAQKWSDDSGSASFSIIGCSASAKSPAKSVFQTLTLPELQTVDLSYQYDCSLKGAMINCIYREFAIYRMGNVG